MADVVTSQTIADTVGVKTVMKFTNISDGSGETLAVSYTHLTLPTKRIV